MSGNRVRTNVAVAVLMLVAAALIGRQLSAQKGSASAAKSAADQVQVIEMTAKRFDFTPEEIRVKKGVRVQLKITATDRSHGIRIKVRPEGADDKSPIGLRFADGQDNWRLAREETRIIEFVAERAGTYEFECSVFCGYAHMGMSGKIIVE